MCLYKGFWCPVNALHAVLSCQKDFNALETDIILATMPKAGTVWLKAITFTIANRCRFTNQTTPLLTTSPHVLVPFLEFQVFMDHDNPGIFSTHMPRQALPDSIFQEKGCKIVYICRNPLDQFISYRHFLLANKAEPEYEPKNIDEALEMFCQGIHLFGPFWDHVLDYWKMSLESPDKVLFLKYEDLKDDTSFNVKKIADFIGFPFSKDEEKLGVIEDVEKLCSFDNLKSLEAAYLEKNPDHPGYRKGIYRKGEVGDWVNYLSPAMAERVQELMEEKLSGSGLSFKSLS
ncbi:cytosolic sulfotransferase 15 [Phtheirospermum japonicum]|uniref:Sulfotransferase n=1 Tax=Phtheirospermum japonicum TaxID=374723 RepID=A0A830BM29_9LAMI|nr:cytosolic sulfotransferase 15 [Phtheirospermum japonicum]